jgi:hypothetical protein
MLWPRIEAEQAEVLRLCDVSLKYMEANPLAEPEVTAAGQAASIRALEQELHSLRAREELLRMRSAPRHAWATQTAHPAGADIMAPSHAAGGDIISDLYDE